MNVERSFDSASRLGTQTDPSGSFAWSYNPWNGLPASVTNAASGVHVAYAWDILDRPTNIVWRNADGDTLRAFSYLYDMAGCITNLLMEGEALPSRTTAYGYDRLDRLTSVSVYTNLQPTAYSLSTFSYDLADNRTNATHNGDSTTYTLGIGDRLASTADGATYLYNAAGCVTNIVRGGTEMNLHWNSQYQLTSVSTNGVVVEAYQYDALGRRISTTAGGISTCHVYDDNWQVLADLDSSGQPLRSYTWAPGIDRLLAITVYTETATNTYHALTDHLGTVHALVDASGAIAESYEFDAWGNVLAVYDGSGTPISNRQSAIGNRYLFQGREYSFAAGLYHFRHRWYDPSTGRWMSNDPIGISGGLNQYVFCGNSPVNRTDPLGLEMFPGGDFPPGTIFGARFGDMTELPSAVGEVAGDIWNSPNTLLGLGLGGAGLLAGGNTPYRDNGTIVFPNNPAAGLFPIMAIVLGDAMHYAPGYEPGTDVYWRYDGLPTHYLLGDHEGYHVPQERRWGPLFIPAYLIAELFPGANPFENAADNTAERAYQERCGK